MADVPTPAAGARNLSPEEIAAQSFASAFRGYDPAHVRTFLAQVSDRVAVLQARNAELERELEHLRDEAKAAREQLAHPSPSPASVAAASEFSGLLQAARERALEIEAAAAEQAERLLAEARERADHIREEAEAELAEANARADRLAAERVAGADEMVASLRAEADALGVKIRQDAEREAATRIVDAREEADRIIEAAKEQGREVVREAQALIMKRKRAAEAQLDQLRDARDRLLSNLQAARRSVDEVIVGVESGRPAESIREAGTTDAEAEPGTSPSSETPGADAIPASGSERATVTPPRGLTVVTPPKRTAELVGSRAAPPTEAKAEATSEPEPEEERVEERRSSALRILRRGKPEVRKAVAAQPVHPLGEPVEGVRIIGRKATEGAAEEAAEARVASEPDVAAEGLEGAEAADAGEAAPAPEDETENEPEPEPEPEVAATAEPESPTAPPRKVDELFARIRADREAAVTKAEQVLAEPTTKAEVDPEPAALVDAEREEVTGNEDEALLQTRDTAVETTESQLTRRLKRALQDEQNELLDGLRNVRAQLSVENLLGDAAAHRDRYASLAKPFLAAVARDVAGDDGEAAIASLPNELASDIVDALRHRLSRILAECASDGADAGVVGERTSAIYREWKTQRAGASASHYVVAAHAAASYAAMPEGAEGVWVVDDGGTPCPDCDDNALAGPTSRGERFPTGQLHPPAHAGCRCVVRVLKAALTT